MSVQTSEQLSQLKDFLAHIATVKGDLSTVTAPPFVLARKSATEFPASWAIHHSLFLAQGASPDPAQRALAVLKNFLASLKAQTYTGSSEADGAKKPLNAFLGELFLAEFDGPPEPAHRTRLIAEQVSHHPPVTACYLHNAAHGISAEGYVAQETTYSATQGVTVKQVGHAVVTIEQYAEEHLMTLPTLRVKGILTGSPYPELGGTCYITSTSGFSSRVEFEGTKLLGLRGKKNSVTAVVYRTAEPETILYKVTGTWNEAFVVHDVVAGQDVETINIDALETTPLLVPPIEEQDPWETRRAWSKVIASIVKGDVKGVSVHKHELEQAQRQMRKDEEQAGTAWTPVFYRRTQPDDARIQLLRAANEELNDGRTAGFWRFVGAEAAQNVQRPYHGGDIAPTGRALQ